MNHSFLIAIPDKIPSNSIIDYSLAAESEEYAAVPEFPIGSTVLLTFSVLAYVILTRYPSKVYSKSCFCNKSKVGCKFSSIRLFFK